MSLLSIPINAMLHCIQIFMNTCEVMVQVKRYMRMTHCAIEFMLLPNSTYYKYLCLHWVSTLFGMIWCLFFKTLLQGFDLYTMFFLHCKCSMSLGACTHHNVMELPFKGVERRDIYEASSALRHLYQNNHMYIFTLQYVQTNVTHRFLCYFLAWSVNR
mgnify:CR=1 FL=1